MDSHKFSSLLIDNAHACDLMCRHYCTQIIYFNIVYNLKIKLHQTLYKLSSYTLDFNII